MMVAAGGPPTIVLAIGSTLKADGARPKVHIILAPATTCIPIDKYLSRYGLFNLSGSTGRQIKAHPYKQLIVFCYFFRRSGHSS